MAKKKLGPPIVHKIAPGEKKELSHQDQDKYTVLVEMEVEKKNKSITETVRVWIEKKGKTLALGALFTNNGHKSLLGLIYDVPIKIWHSSETETVVLTEKTLDFDEYPFSFEYRQFLLV